MQNSFRIFDQVFIAKLVTASCKKMAKIPFLEMMLENGSEGGWV